jgi:multiple sugar transport system substrate-binding protein
MNDHHLRHQRFTRRALAFGAAASLSPATLRAQGATPVPTPVPASLAGSTLRLLTWQRPVTGFDTAYEAIVREWADRNGVGLTIEWMAAETVVDAITNEIELGQGHDLIDTPQPVPKAEPVMQDHSALLDELRTTAGEPVALCSDATFNPVSGKRWGIAYAWEPAVGIFRGSLWQQAGFAWGPVTVDELLQGGTWIWNERGVQVALGLSPIPVAECAAQTVIWAHAGAVQDAEEQVVLPSEGTAQALDAMRQLFLQTTTPVVLHWQSDRDVTEFMRNGFGSYTIGGLHDLRAIALQTPEIAADLFLTTPVSGSGVPARAMPVSLPTLMIPLWNPNPGPAAALVKELVQRSPDLLIASQLVYLPAYPDLVPDLFTASGPLQADPFDLTNPGKLIPLLQAESWTVGGGWPGPWNPMIEAGHRQGLLTRMLTDAATGARSDADAMNLTADAFTLLAEAWREAGLMQPGSSSGVG